MKLFRDLLLSRAGSTAIILGGGPSCPGDYARVLGREPKVVLSANLHGLKLGRCDYVVSVDEERADEWKLNHADVPLISYLKDSTYRIVEYPHLTMSGVHAAWIAWNLGAAPILLCGMGCYSETGTYFHEAHAFSTGNRIDLETHLKFWIQLRSVLPPDAPIRVVSGPVEKVFPKYDPDEDFSGYRLPERLSLIRSQTGVLVRVVSPKCRVGSERFDPGQIVELSARDAQNLISQRRVMKVHSA